MDILIEAPNLLRRYREGKVFRQYVRDRMPLVVGALFVFLAFSAATTAGTIVYIGGTHTFLILLAMLLAPFLLVGSLGVLLFIFFSWLEVRAMSGGAAAASVMSVAALRTALAALPIPWVLAAVFVGAPLVLVALLSPQTALVLVAAGILTPVVFTFLER